MLVQKISRKNMGWKKLKGLIGIILMLVLFSVNVDVARAANLPDTLAIAGVVSDDFSAPALNSSLWKTIDPLGDSTFTMSGTGTQDASVNIVIPAGGGAHNVLGVNNAPRIMQTVKNSNFEIEAKFLSPISKAYQIQGIIIQQDSANYLRFDFSRNSTMTYVYAASTTAGVTTMRYYAKITPGNNPLYLRVKRFANTWTQAYSYNGMNWTPGATFSHSLVVSTVGPFAGTAIANLSFTGKIDYFFNTSSPIKYEDRIGTHPKITLWYGKSQKFGQIGAPQKWINILGNVASADGIASLKYSLNNASVKNLSIGTQSLRLSSIGDFNIEINRSDLLCSNNRVMINAKDRLGNTTTEIVNVNYSCNNVWPKNYTINWSKKKSIQDAAQIVDGLWTKDANSIRPAIQGYDRIVAIGDMTWDDYEISVPITINTPLDSSAPNGGPNFGFSMRWQGHSKTSNEQPGDKWWPIGAIGGYFFTGSTYALKIIGHNDTKTTTIAIDKSGKQLTVGVPYMFKMRAKTNGTRTLYTLKVWKQSASELTAVTISGYGDSIGLKKGSAMLNSHYGNVSFGNVTIRSLGSDIGPGTANLIANPGFESGTTSWTNGTGVPFSAISPGYEGSKAAKLTIKSGTNLQLYQKNVPLETGRYLEPNTRYRLSFSAYSTTGHDMKVKLIKHVSPYTSYGLDQTFNLNTNWQTFSTVFTTTGFSTNVKDGRLQFLLYGPGLGAKGDIYYIDNVKLEKCTPLANMISNPGFESGNASWMKSTGVTFTALAPGYEGTKSAKLFIGTTAMNLQLYQANIPLGSGLYLEPNKRYRLSFAAYSSLGHDMKVKLIQHVSPYTVYGLDQTFNLNTNWQTFSTEFTTTGFTTNVKNGRLQFLLTGTGLGTMGDIYYIDSIKLEKI